MERLKIKDNVNLEELEKFGFEITKNHWETLGEDCFEAVKTIYNDNVLKICIIVHERDIFSRVEVNCDDNGYGYYNHEDICLTTYYDLIQAGFIEKVSDK